MTQTKGYLPGPYGQVHYYESGDGPPLVLAHQSPVCGRQFEQAMPLLAKAGLRAIAVDTPGFGMSDLPTVPPDIAGYADAFLSVLDGLEIDRLHALDDRSFQQGSYERITIHAKPPGQAPVVVFFKAHFAFQEVFFLGVRVVGDRLDTVEGAEGVGVFEVQPLVAADEVVVERASAVDRPGLAEERVCSFAIPEVPAVG